MQREATDLEPGRKVEHDFLEFLFEFRGKFLIQRRILGRIPTRIALFGVRGELRSETVASGETDSGIEVWVGGFLMLGVIRVIRVRKLVGIRGRGIRIAAVFAVLVTVLITA